MINKTMKHEMWNGLVSAAPYPNAEAIVAQLRNDPDFANLRGLWVLTEIEAGSTLPDIILEVAPFSADAYRRVADKLFDILPFNISTPLTAILFGEQPNLPLTGVREDYFYFLTHGMVRKIYLDEAWAKTAGEQYREVSQ